MLIEGSCLAFGRVEGNGHPRSSQYKCVLHGISMVWARSPCVNSQEASAGLSCVQNMWRVHRPWR